MSLLNTSVSAQLCQNQGLFKVGLVIEDLGKGWTNRRTCKFSNRFKLEQTLKQG